MSNQLTTVSRVDLQPTHLLNCVLLIKLKREKVKQIPAKKWDLLHFLAPELMKHNIYNEA